MTFFAFGRLFSHYYDCYVYYANTPGLYSHITPAKLNSFFFSAVVVVVVVSFACVNERGDDWLLWLSTESTMLIYCSYWESPIEIQVFRNRKKKITYMMVITAEVKKKNWLKSCMCEMVQSHGKTKIWLLLQVRLVFDRLVDELFWIAMILYFFVADKTHGLFSFHWLGMHSNTLENISEK